jgi:hypothetical protein
VVFDGRQRQNAEDIMKLHIVHVTWNEGEEDTTTKESIGCLVATLEKEVLLSNTYDGSFDHFPVVVSIANEDIVDLRTICLIEI